MSDRETERGLETPEADVADDYTRAEESFTVPDEADAADVVEEHVTRESSGQWPDGIPAEANEADAAEQHLPARDDLDEDDDYR